MYHRFAENANPGGSRFFDTQCGLCYDGRAPKWQEPDLATKDTKEGSGRVALPTLEGEDDV